MSPSDPTFKTDELLLHVRSDFDPNLLRLDKYEAFLDALCGDREYQKDAIRAACRLLGGGQYATTADLADQNYANNPFLSEHYGSLDGLIARLPFSGRLGCSVDLATGTGKSWAMYAIARILLAEGIVDRVLVLTPSLTIESELRAKFTQFSSEQTLTDLVPDDAVVRNPEIKDATQTTLAGDICIENIHATFQHVKSSVRDSFAGKGPTTLVLNDETHHVFSPPTGQRDIKKWKSFLDDDEFGFHRIVGFSGTCYIGNDYFPDVVSRYSLRSAMEDGRVKIVHYVARDESATQDERFQKWLQVHDENKTRYPQRKPLTIVVTATIDGAQNLADEFVRFLARELNVSPGEAEKRVLIVTSRHQDGVAKLPYVDRNDYPTEWIFSVSMLTEGWDVQNVFQVVPHEKRAFNSKLLIAQVLGRGLRTSSLDRPVLRVFNHSNWSSEIRNLVAEVLEQERRLHSHPVASGQHAKHHFELDQLTYTTRTYEQELKPKNGNGQLSLFKRGYIRFESQPKELKRQTTFASALDRSEYVVSSTVHYPAYTVAEVVAKLRARLKSVDLEAGTQYAKDYPSKKLREVIQKSLEVIGETRDLVSESNLQHAFRAIGTIKRKIAKAVRIELEPNQLVQLSTRDVRSRSVAHSSFSKEATVFHDTESIELSEDADRQLLKEIIEDEHLPKSSETQVDNKFFFKSPANLVLTSHEPERRFVRRLFEPDIADALDGWIKSPDVGFYEIGYSWRKGDHQKQAKFNPDFFLVLKGGKVVLVVELKADTDDSDENRAKLKYATAHFERVNSAQKRRTYYFKMLSPSSYDPFFQALRDGKAQKFVSSLEAKLFEWLAVAAPRDPERE